MSESTPSSCNAVALAWRRSPSDVIARWPLDRRLFALVSSGDHAGARRSRWTILTEPSPREVALRSAADVEAFDGALAQTRVPAAAPLPFTGGWIGWLSYELGAVLEPAVGPTIGAPALGRWAHCPAALLFDHDSERWWAVGAEDPRAALIDAAQRPSTSPDGATDWSAGTLRSVEGPDAYKRAVARAVEWVHAGDVFQVNLAHRMRAEFEGSSRGLFLALLRQARPDFGALLEWHADRGRQDPAAIVSISPELFLSADLFAAGERRIVSRPIKGTRAARSGAEAELCTSAKDLAELNMIVDLMRNDLGRVCAPGSVRVDAPRDLERHAGGDLLHAVATVSGNLRSGVTPSALLRAAFPPGSVTGAPKIRAMQIIRELEAAPRGVYCGAIGCFSDHGPAALSVAIRTASIFADGRASAPGRIRGVLEFPVGAGIVAESDPESEWQETLAKAHAFASVLNASARPMEAAPS